MINEVLKLQFPNSIQWDLTEKQRKRCAEISTLRFYRKRLFELDPLLARKIQLELIDLSFDMPLQEKFDEVDKIHMEFE